MRDPVDEALARLAAQPMDRELDGLEAAVMRAVRHRRREARTAAALAPVGVASVSLALALGIMTGSVAASSMLSQARNAGALSLAVEIAPSTLLEGRS